MPEEAGTYTVKCGSRWRRELLEDLGSLLSTQSLAGWPPFLKELCGGDGVVVQELYSIFTFGPLHNFQLRVSRLSKKCLNQ